MSRCAGIMPAVRVGWPGMLGLVHIIRIRGCVAPGTEEPTSQCAEGAPTDLMIGDHSYSNSITLLQIPLCQCC